MTQLQGWIVIFLLFSIFMEIPTSAVREILTRLKEKK